MGTAFTVLCMQAHGPRLIALTGCMPDLIAPAWEYMRVRAWSMPPILYTLVGMVSKLEHTPTIGYTLHKMRRLRLSISASHA